MDGLEKFGHSTNYDYEAEQNLAQEFERLRASHERLLGILGQLVNGYERGTAMPLYDLIPRAKEAISQAQEVGK